MSHRGRFILVLACVLFPIVALAVTAVSFSIPDNAATILTRDMTERNAGFAAQPAPQPTPYASLNAYLRDEVIALAAAAKARQDVLDNAGNRPYGAQLSGYRAYCASLTAPQKTACGQPCSYCP